MSASLLFDEIAYEKLSEVKKPIFVFDWLCSLETRLLTENKSVIKECQEDLVQQLLSHLTHAPGRPTHKLLGRCFANLFLVGDSLLLYTAVNTCNALLKSRDDAPACINSRLAALSCLGAIYKRLGRMIGRTFEDSVIIMAKLIKQSESQVRCETMNTFCSLIEGVGSASAVCHKEIYKAAKICMTDRVLYVRVAAAKCLYFLVDHSQTIHTSELEATVSLCLRCMDGANYATRIEASRTLGHLLAKTQRKKVNDPGSDASNSGSTGASSNSRNKTVTLTDALSLLSSGFLKGPGGFLKGTSATDMIKGTSPVNREVRVGVTYAYIEFIVEMGPQWFESNLSTILTHLVNLLLIPRATPTHVEAICARQCIQYLLGTVFRHLLSESVQLVAISELVKILTFHLQFLQNLHMNEYSGNSGDVFQQIFSSSSSSSTLTPVGGGAGNSGCNINESTDVLPNDMFNETTLGNNNNPDEINGDYQTSVTGTHNLDSFTEPDNGKIRRAFGLQSSATGNSTTTTTTAAVGSSSRSNREQQHQHLVICVLDIISQLIRWLDSLVVQLLDQPTQLANVLCTCLTHPVHGVRLAAASCLRQLVIVVPSQRIPLLNRCLLCLQQSYRYNADTLLGVTCGITGLLAGVNCSLLGLSNNLPKQMFSLAEDLLRAANQNSRFTLARTQSGWSLLAACITLGPNIVKSHLPRIFLFWRNAFPRSLRELEAEKQRGDAFTWQVMLESRAGALCSIQSFLEYCSQLLTDDIIHRLLSLIDCALNMLAQMNDIVRIYGNHLKSTAGFIRLRLYRILLLLPSTAYTGSYSTVLRELVAEFTLTDNMANTTTSIFRSLCRSEDSVTLASCLQDTDQRLLEEQLQPTALNNSPGSLEHDPSYLYLRDGVASVLATDVIFTNLSNTEDEFNENVTLTAGTLFHGPSDVMSTSGVFSTSKFHNINSTCDSSTLLSFSHNSSHFSNTSLSYALQLTGPMPVNVAVIDASIELFGRLFACVSIRHRIQMLEHFAECIRLTKSIRQEAVQINVFAGLLSALRYLAETKLPFGDDPQLRKATTNLIFATLTSPSVLLRCVAGECLGRLAQVVGESSLLAELAQQIFERLRTIRNPIARAGHCLAIGCLHRYVGGLASRQHLSSSVGVLLAIAQDSSVPEVQVWALHSLALVADSGGPIFREYVEPSLNLVLQLLLKAPSAMHEIQRGLGRLFAALITTLGPELRGTGASITSVRHSCLLCCLIMRDSPDALLQAEGVACLQQLHMFAPMHVKLAGLVPELQASLTSSDLVLRRAALSCLRQLSQKEAMDLYGYMTRSTLSSDELLPPALSTLSTLSNKDDSNNNNGDLSKTNFTNCNTKLELQLFSLLDVEMDYQLRRDIQDTLIGMLHATGTSQLTHWFSILREVLQVSTTLRPDVVNNQTVDTIKMTNSRRKSSNPKDNLSNNTDMSQRNGNTIEEGSVVEQPGDVDNDNDDDEEDVDVNFKPKQISQEVNRLFCVKITARSSTKIFAISCLRVLISSCAKLCNASLLTENYQSNQISVNTYDETSDVIVNPSSIAHFDLAKARALRSQSGKSDWLILYLSDLIRIAFMSATSESDRLRITGLKLMQDVVQRFSPVPDPDYPDHIILEQYQAQVSAALRPAFISTSSLDLSENTTITESSTPNISTSSSIVQSNPELLSIACQVCSSWITSGVGRDPEDLRRVQDLLKQALNKLKLDQSIREDHSSNSCVQGQRTESSSSSQWMSENSTIVERLSILAAWAEIYIVTAGQAKKLGGKLHQKQHLETSQSQPLDEDQPIDESDEMNTSENEDESDYSIIIKGISLEDMLSTATTSATTTTPSRSIHQLLTKWIQPILPGLSQAWLSALRDYAYMCLPDSLSNQQQQQQSSDVIKNSSDHFNINNSNNLDQIRVYYARYWPCMTYALALWLTNESSSFVDENKTNSKNDMSKSSRHFFLILGMCVEAMCNTTSKQPISIIHTCLRCILCLLSRSKFRAYLMQSSTEISIELLQVLHRLLLTRDCIETHLLCLANMIHILIAANERLTKERDDWLTKESTQNNNATSMFISPELKTSKKNNCMTSSIMLQTTGLIDTQMYEHGEGGYLAKFFDRINDADNVDCDSNNNNNNNSNNTTISTENQMMNTSNIYGKTFAGLHPERSIVFTCLEIVVCIVARYQPQIIKQLRLSNTDSNNNSNNESKTYNIIPETICASDINAPRILATALKSLIPLIDLCAPRTLLSTLRLAKQNANTQSNDGINHSQIMNTESEVNQLPSSNSQSTTTTTTIHQQECLLPIVLDLANEITKCVLLKPLQCSNAASNYVLKDSRVMKSTEDSSNTITTTTNNNNLVNMFKSCDLAYQSSSNSFTSCLIGDEDTEISSTTTNLSVGINDGGLGIKSCSKRQHYRYIGYLIGWTEQSTELAEAFITVMQKLAGHHYPAIAAASGVASTAPASSTYNHDVCMTKSTGVGDSQTTENQPDSSSIINMKEEIIVNSNHIDLDMTSQSICGENRMKEHASENACIEWYRLISMNLLSILQHNHDKETETDVYPLRRCCLASAYLVSRICNNCPLQVFKSSELTSVLSNLLYRGWNLPKLLDNSQTDVLTNGNVNSSPEDPLILNNGNNVISNLLNSNCLQSRIICLGSFESLCSHHESSISALFIKTLTPQVFRWLYDLTKIVEMHSASSSKDQQQQYQQKQQKLFDKSSDIYHNQINLEELTICLNTSFDLLTSLINKAENSNRQALLLIYLSLLCNLLSNESSMLSNQCHSKSSTLFIPYNSSDLFYFIHTITLKHVITIAPCFPNEFRSAFQILGDLKQRLENAIKLSTPLTNTNAAVSGGGGGGGGGSHGNNNNMSVQNQLKSHVIKGIPFNAYHQNNRSVMTKQSQVSSPSIKLKTDFSNFT